MPVRVYSEDEQRALNESSVAANKTKLGTTLAVMQEAINSGGGGGGGGGDVTGGANLGTGAEVFKDKAGTNLRFRTLVAGPNVAISELADEIQISASGGGGGGGGAYPDNVTVKNSNATLVESEQGLVGSTAAVSLTLPSSPAIGTTYKVIALNFPITVLANTGQIIAVISATSAKIYNKIVEFVYIGMGIWLPVRWNSLAPVGAWIADEKYWPRDIVEHSGEYWLNVGNPSPGAEPGVSSFWLKIS